MVIAVRLSRYTFRVLASTDSGHKWSGVMSSQCLPISSFDCHDLDHDQQNLTIAIISIILIIVTNLRFHLLLGSGAAAGGSWPAAAGRPGTLLVIIIVIIVIVLSIVIIVIIILIVGIIYVVVIKILMKSKHNFYNCQYLG